MNSLSWEDLTGIVTGGGGSMEGPIQMSTGGIGGATGTCWQSAPITAATFNKELVEEQGLIYALLDRMHF